MQLQGEARGEREKERERKRNTAKIQRDETKWCLKGGGCSVKIYTNYTAL